jgi:uncharacterized protein YggU (UPF0235/DUF167 family)
LTSTAGTVRARQTGETLEFWIHVTPRPRRARVGGIHADALRVAVTAAPVGGAANEACARALAEAFDVRRGAVGLAPGARGRRKKVAVHGDPDALLRRLATLAALRRSD